MLIFMALIQFIFVRYLACAFSRFSERLGTRFYSIAFIIIFTSRFFADSGTDQLPS